VSRDRWQIHARAAQPRFSLFWILVTSSWPVSALAAICIQAHAGAARIPVAFATPVNVIEFTESQE
jgi:hypothetical protein